MTDQKTVTIVCKAKRKDGSKIELYGKHYHFKPVDPLDPESLHVCAIPHDDARQIYRLLSIKDGYALLDPDAELPARPTQSSGPTIAEDSAGAAAPGDKPVMISDGEGGEVNLSAMSREDLTEFAKTNFGITVHHKWKAPTIIAKIVEATRAEAE